MDIFERVENECKEELKAIRKQYKAEPFKFVRPVPNFTYKEAIDMLIESGDKNAFYYEDLTTPQEKVLGSLIKKKYNTDF